MQKKYFKLLISIPVLAIALFVTINHAHAFSLQNYYTFDGDIDDHSGSGNDLTSSGVGVFDPVGTAKIGTNSVLATGAGDAGGIVSSSGFPANISGGDWSVSYWFKTNKNCSAQLCVMMDYRSGTGNGYFLSSLYDNHASFNVMGYGTDVGGNLNDNNWHLMNLTHASDGTVTMYVDSVQVAQHAQGSDTTDANEQLTVGCSIGITACIGGSLDDMGFINSVLSQGDIDGIYDGGTGVALDFAISVPSIGLCLPTSELTTADFINWCTNLTDIDSGDTVAIFYSTVSRGGVGHENDYEYLDAKLWHTPYVTDNFLIPKEQALWFPPQQLNADWYVFAEIISDAPDGFQDTYVKANSAEIHFIVNATAPLVFTPTSTTPYNFATTSENIISCGQFPFISTYNAYITDFPFFATTTADRLVCEGKKGLIWATQFLFIPGGDSSPIVLAVGNPIELLKQDLQNAKQILPFALYFNVADSIQRAAASSTVPSQTVSFNTPSFPSGDYNRQVTFITSSTLTNALTNDVCNTTCANETKDRWFGWATVVIWASTGLAVIGMVL